jgi:hypothetical protein
MKKISTWQFCYLWNLGTSGMEQEYYIKTVKFNNLSYVVYPLMVQQCQASRYTDFYTIMAQKASWISLHR